MLGWMDNWQYAAQLPTSPWRGQMTVPRKLALRSTSEGLRLQQQPADELQGLREQSFGAAGKSIEELNSNLIELGPKLGDYFELKTEFDIGSATEVGWKLFVGPGESLVIGYDRNTGKLFMDRTHAGVTGFNHDFPARTEAALKVDSGKLTLDILVDRSSVELFAEQGRVTMTNLVFPSARARGIEAYSRGGQIASMRFQAWKLRSVYQRSGRETSERR